MRSIDRLGWADGICFTSYGLRIGIRANTPEVLQRVVDRLPPGWEPAGLTLIGEVTRSGRTPTLAIGGVNAEKVDEVVRAGASGVAVISAILAQRDRQAAAEGLRRALDAAWAAIGAARR